MTEAEYIERLNKIYTYTREGDGKIFRITFYGHWTDIQAADGETDSVKLGWPCEGYDRMISNQKGHSYRRTSNRKLGDVA